MIILHKYYINKRKKKDNKKKNHIYNTFSHFSIKSKKFR